MVFHVMWRRNFVGDKLKYRFWFLWAPTKYHCKSSKRVPADGAHGADDDDDVEHEPQIVCSGLRKDATLHRRQRKHYSFHNYLTCGREIKRKYNLKGKLWSGTEHFAHNAESVPNTPIKKKKKLFTLRSAQDASIFTEISFLQCGCLYGRLGSGVADFTVHRSLVGDADGYRVV